MVKYYQSKGEFYMKQNTIEHLAKLARNKYHNNWQRQNPEKVKKAQKLNAFDQYLTERSLCLLT